MKSRPPPAYLKFTIGIRSQAAINTLDRKKYIFVIISYIIYKIFPITGIMHS
jgi:hypothetical protein